jgi:hypothetical protein
MGRASRRKKERERRVNLGAAWYSRDEWHKLRSVAADPDQLEDSYEKWTAVFEQAIRDMAAAGIEAQRVPINVDQLVEWCKIEGVPVDRDARARFAAIKLQERYERGAAES